LTAQNTERSKGRIREKRKEKDQKKATSNKLLLAEPFT
jgi:hypothetical protein